MNEFIVWYSNDINKDKFSKEFTLQELISQDHYDYISDSPLLVNYKVDSIKDGIGLKDINGKSIYADSSIIEFFDHKQDYFKGYFTFNIKKLAYEIIIFGLNEDFRDVITYCKDNITNTRIIDTMQENKLGLV